MGKKLRQKFIVQIDQLNEIRVFENQNAAKECMKEIMAQGLNAQIHIDLIGDFATIRKYCEDIY